MIGYIKGNVVYRSANYVIIDTGGVGYKVYVSPTLLGNEKLTLFCFHQVREDTSNIYGFSKAEELEIFELLLSVNGVGPKAALSLVGALGKERILQSIAQGDLSVFKSIPGIGNKVAAKIIVELKSKVVSGDKGSFLLPEDDETVEAMVTLGYKKSEILPYLAKLPANITSVQDKVKYVLKNIGKKP